MAKTKSKSAAAKPAPAAAAPRVATAPAIDIGLSTAERRKIADGLSHFLADAYTLYLKTHNFHWNITGPMFNSLHLMFETQYNEQWTALDLDRKSVVEGKSVSVRVDRGGRGIIKKKNKKQSGRNR